MNPFEVFDRISLLLMITVPPAIIVAGVLVANMSDDQFRRFITWFAVRLSNLVRIK